VLTLAAQVDSKGRWAAAAGGVFTLSTAFGPILGGVLIEKFGYSAIAWLQLLAVVPGVYIFARVQREIN
jgi:predicted MFS family arabinose efflux permease